MRAIMLHGTLDDPRIVLADVEPPKDGPGRLIVEVVSAGVSRMEPSWITNWEDADGAPRPRPVGLGLEFAGRIRSTGAGVEGFSVGQDVMGMLDAYHAGAMAERLGVEAERVLPVPSGLSYEEASSLPLSGLTAFQALVRHGGLRQGQRVLIHGGAGAVGTFALQIARSIGAHVVATASARDEALCRRLGADEVIDYRCERFEDRGGGYDLVFDQVGGDVQERSWSLLKRGGRLVTIAGDGMDASGQERASALGVIALFFIVDGDTNDLRRLAEMAAAGTVQPVIGNRYRLDSAAAAFDERAGRLAGKAVVACSDALGADGPARGR